MFKTPRVETPPGPKTELYIDPRLLPINPNNPENNTLRHLLEPIQRTVSESPSFAAEIRINPIDDERPYTILEVHIKLKDLGPGGRITEIIFRRSTIGEN